MNTLNQEFKEKLEELARLSSEKNKNDKQKLFSMIKDHCFEIEELYKNKNDHWAVETADLIVLCFELLISENKKIDDVFSKCLPRFYKKLALIDDGCEA